MSDSRTADEPLVVLIEDEHAVAMRVRGELVAAGFRVIASTNGPEALRIIDSQGGRVRAVVAEIAMPALGGRAIAELLAEHHPSVPVVRVSRASLSGTMPATAATAPLDVGNVELLIATLRMVATPPAVSDSAAGPVAALLSKERHGGVLCPRCASARVAAILYGADRLQRREDVAAGRVVLGAAVHPPDGPVWFCRDCEHRWAS